MVDALEQLDLGFCSGNASTNKISFETHFRSGFIVASSAASQSFCSTSSLTLQMSMSALSAAAVAAPREQACGLGMHMACSFTVSCRAGLRRRLRGCIERVRGPAQQPCETRSQLARCLGDTVIPVGARANKCSARNSQIAVSNPCRGLCNEYRCPHG